MRFLIDLSHFFRVNQKRLSRWVSNFNFDPYNRSFMLYNIGFYP